MWLFEWIPGQVRGALGNQFIVGIAAHIHTFAKKLTVFGAGGRHTRQARRGADQHFATIIDRVN